MKVFFAILLTIIGVFFGVSAANSWGNSYSSGVAAVLGAIAAACLLGVYLLIRRPAAKASDAQGK